MVERLETLRRGDGLKFALGIPATGSSVNLKVNGYLCSCQKRIRYQKKRDGLRLPCAVLKTQYGSNAHIFLRR